MLIRVQKHFPATGEILAPFSIAHYVGGFMRGSHVGPLMPVPHGTGCSYFDGPPIVSCFGFCVHNGKLTDTVDLFDHPFWRSVQDRAANKAVEIRRQGFSGPAMLSYGELEYGGIVNILEKLDAKFKVRSAQRRRQFRFEICMYRATRRLSRRDGFGSLPTERTMRTSKVKSPKTARPANGEQLHPVAPAPNGSEHLRHASEDEIRILAYHKWVSAGCPESDGVQFWHEAELELSR